MLINMLAINMYLWSDLLEGKHSDNSQQEANDGDSYADVGDERQRSVHMFVDGLAILLPQAHILCK